MLYPALDVSGIESELLDALIDDFSPTAADPQDDRTIYFFASGIDRDRALAAVAAAWPGAQLVSREIDDEDWARRSQDTLTPITVGRLTIAPPWSPPPQSADSGAITIVITPSMGFGTGHHATTRLCLAAMQQLDLEGKTVLDVGTGSGVLAIAARALGAASATGIDSDPDAVQAAIENLDANPAATNVAFLTADLRAANLPRADILTANLMGALLVQTAPRLLSCLRPGGQIIVSGLLDHERDVVAGAFSHGAVLVGEHAEDGWVALVFTPVARRL